MEREAETVKSAMKTTTDPVVVKKGNVATNHGARAKHRPKGQPNLADLAKARRLPPFLIRSF